MDGMFYGATKFNQQMCGWTVNLTQVFVNLTQAEDMFDGSLCSVESCIECPE